MARSRARRQRAAENAALRNSNALTRRYRPPRMMVNGGVTTVTGSELLYSVNVGSAGVVAQLATNFLRANTSGSATLKGTWLQQIAVCFNKYKFQRLTLRYVPFCSTQTSGRILIGWTGDENDSVPTTTQQVSQYQNACEAPVWRETACNALISRTPEYVITNDASASESGVADQGAFIYALDNGSSSTPVAAGSFYIDYEIQLWSRASFATNS